jgi:hypothetical protein
MAGSGLAGSDRIGSGAVSGDRARPVGLDLAGRSGAAWGSGGMRCGIWPGSGMAGPLAEELTDRVWSLVGELTTSLSSVVRELDAMTDPATVAAELEAHCMGLGGSMGLCVIGPIWSGGPVSCGVAGWGLGPVRIRLGKPSGMRGLVGQSDRLGRSDLISRLRLASRGKSWLPAGSGAKGVNQLTLRLRWPGA